MSEEKKVIFDGCYEVSRSGQIRRIGGLQKKNARFLGRVLKQSTNVHGYRAVVLSVHGESKTMTVHRVVSNAFLGPRPEGMSVDHIDNNKTNNHADNLRYITPAENLFKYQESVRTGVLPRPRGKVICEADAIEIRRLSKSGMKGNAIARKFGVSANMVSLIIIGKLWIPAALSAKLED